MKIIKRILPIIVLVIGFIGGIIFYASASTYNSEEISYNNSISGSTKTNVKDAVDDLYSHLGDCPEGKICLTGNEWVTTIQSSGWSAVGTEGAADTCNSAEENCVCYYIYNYETGRDTVSTRGQSFTYNGHTGCNFKSTTCKYAHARNGADAFDCVGLHLNGYHNYWAGPNRGDTTGYGFYDLASCSGIIACAT